MNQKTSKQYLSLSICILFLVSSFWTAANLNKWSKTSILNWDIAGYHLYLTGAIAHHDITEYTFYKRIDSIYHPSLDVQYYAIDKHPITGIRVNKYTMGVAYFELPAFLIAQFYALNTTHASDGFSSPYQFAVFISTLLAVFLGLLILRRFLLECDFKDYAVALTLGILSFGTNLFFYTIYHPGMGHPFSFFLYACILLLTLRLFKTYKLKYFILLGLCIGLAVLIRPVDIFVILIPVLWPLKSFVTTYKLLFSKYKFHILLGLLFVSLPWIPQLIYWKYTTGHFLYYSYANEGFNFTDPQIFKGLFSYQKGWFIYTPLALLGVLSLLASLRDKRYKRYAISAIIFYAISFWVIFSWHQWFYGGSFGSRVMVNSLPLLAIPLALFFEKLTKRKMIIKVLATLTISFFIYLNIFQSYQYEHTIIHWDSMHKDYYWRVFLKNEITEEDKKLL